MKNPLKAYDWGHPTYIHDLLGGPPGLPAVQAELWLGAHPGDSSQVDTASGLQPLNELISSEPAYWLGDKLAAAGERSLPFLLKILAASKVLSIQCHPSMASARDGFAREEAAGIAIKAPERSFKDARHKPELFVALTPFAALAGFRSMMSISQDLRELAFRAQPGTASAQTLLELANTAAKGQVIDLCREILSIPRGDEVLKTLVELSEKTDGERYQRLVASAKDHESDPGLFFFLVLELVKLEAGQAMFTPAGVLHAYLEGACIEIMANSDNVLRGGLTNKIIDIPALLANIDPEGHTELVTPVVTSNGVVRSYRTSAREFTLDRLASTQGDALSLPPSSGPRIVLCIQGTIKVEADNGTVTLEHGQSCILTSSDNGLGLSVNGLAFIAGIPE